MGVIDIEDPTIDGSAAGQSGGIFLQPLGGLSLDLAIKVPLLVGFSIIKVVARGEIHCLQ